jgi:ABC-type phosphate transport system permease subunit
MVWRVQRMMVSLWRLADNFALRITSWMQINAPWTDNTGEARARLKATASHMALTVLIAVAHGVPYGVYLETMQAGRFAILVPAVMEWLPQFFAAAQDVVKQAR